MLQVWPSMTMLRGVRLELRYRIVEEPERLGTQGRAVEVEVSVVEGQLGYRRRPGDLDVDRIRTPSCCRSGT
jgi:hypothetical protein